MENILKNLIGKDENLAQKSADYLVNNSDIKLFEALVDKSEYLFPFVRGNIRKRIEKAVNKSNFSNIINFFSCYSVYYDDLFASILSKHANEDLTDKIFELLEHGTNSQKTYAAKYFSYIPDTIALELLSKYAFCDDENLSANSAEALGQMQDDVSFDIALDNIESNDDFDKLKSVKFFCAYGKNYPFKEIFNALSTSKIPENIAGQIPYMESLLKLLDSEYRNETIISIYYIVLGLGEILPLSDLFQFEMKDVLTELIDLNKIDNDFSAIISAVLLSAFSKFKMFNENEEYVFDEDKETKYEIKSILKLLTSQNDIFWEKQKQYLLRLLKGNEREILISLPIIAEFNLKNAVPDLQKLVSFENETVVCEVLNVLKSINSIGCVDLDDVIIKIKNPNIKAIIETLKI